jgi:hypothetical protein
MVDNMYWKRIGIAMIVFDSFRNFSFEFQTNWFVFWGVWFQLQRHWDSSTSCMRKHQKNQT